MHPAQHHQPRRIRQIGIVLLLLTALGPPASIGSAAPGDTTRVSVASDGTQGNLYSSRGAMSADGRFVAFTSAATNLAPGDTNDSDDIFVYDRQTGATSRVSVASDGTQGDQSSYDPSISTHGRFVAFRSSATNLVPDDTNGAGDVFVHDRWTGVTSRVSVASDGTQGNAESATESGDTALSASGRFVTFLSSASNLVPDDTNDRFDVFVHDQLTGATSRVSTASDGTQGNGDSIRGVVSANGRFVAFESDASNLVPNDTNDHFDVFIHDRQTGATSRISVADDGTQGDGDSVFPSLSADGQTIAFSSLATNLAPGDTNGTWDAFVYDRQTGAASRVSVTSDGRQGNGDSEDTPISADGRFVAFRSLATNLVPDDTNDRYDIFVHDRLTGATSRVSAASDGMQGNLASHAPSLNSDGRFVAFESRATKLVAKDTDHVADVFVHEPDFVYTCHEQTATLVGTSGDDTLTGTEGPDVIVGLGGDDTIFGLGGDDLLCAKGQVNGTPSGWGTDTLNGGDGNDTLVGNQGVDVLAGNAGDDTLYGYRNADDLDGGPGNDTLAGGLGDDTLDGGTATDTLKGGRDTDTCFNGETVWSCEQ